MKYHFLILILISTASSVQAQVVNGFEAEKFTPNDSLTVMTQQWEGNDSAIAQMPIYNPPTDARILVWWPDTDYHYGMPNAIHHKGMQQLQDFSNIGKNEGKDDK